MKKISIAKKNEIDINNGRSVIDLSKTIIKISLKKNGIEILSFKTRKSWLNKTIKKRKLLITINKVNN